MLIIGDWGISCEIALMWLSLDLTKDKLNSYIPNITHYNNTFVFTCSFSLVTFTCRILQGSFTDIG